MRRKTTILLLVSLLALPLAVGAATKSPSFDLTEAGTLCRALANQDGSWSLSVERLDSDIQPIAGVLPTSPGAIVSEVSVSFVEEISTAVVTWQETLAPWHKQVLMATFTDGTWFGPVVVAGSPTSPATHPVHLVHIATTQVGTEDDPETVSTTLILLSWWADEGSEDGGHAMFGSVALDDLGRLDLSTLERRDLTGVIGYSLICSAPAVDGPYVRPVLFLDSASGIPHLLFFDPGACSFEILELDEIVPDDPPVTSKRRRHVVVFGRHLDLGKPLGLSDQLVSYAVGNNLTVIGFWEGEDTLSYVVGDISSGWTEPHAIPLDDHLTHEDAVELIRHLAR